MEMVRVRSPRKSKKFGEFGGKNNLQATDREIIDRRHHFETCPSK